MKNVLVVDDEETLLLIMVNRFEDYADQFNVFTARNGKEAVEVLESESIDFLVTDLKMPEMDGIELLALMSSRYSHIPAMAMSAFSTPEIEKKLAQMGTLRVLDKPVNFDLLADAIIGTLQPDQHADLQRRPVPRGAPRESRGRNRSTVTAPDDEHVENRTRVLGEFLEAERDPTLTGFIKSHGRTPNVTPGWSGPRGVAPRG